MSKREVQFINGEFVLECKIFIILYLFFLCCDEIEFIYMCYMVVICDLDDFVERGYKLCQNIGWIVCEMELFICIIMYNEDEYGFMCMMYVVMKNIFYFCSCNKL